METAKQFCERIDLEEGEVWSNCYDSLSKRMEEYSKNVSLEFAEWIDIHGIRNDRHLWLYKGDGFTKKWTTEEMYNIMRIQTKD